MNNERRGEEDESGKSIGVDNENIVTHPSGHGSFAQCGQAHIQALHHHHGCKRQPTHQRGPQPHLSLSLSKIRVLADLLYQVFASSIGGMRRVRQ